ncbi:4Fe-4S binding protein [Dethiobacter alkaliphilus]|uniref:4Fe-4S binding protein n=1 Tax=Dethiobacter alkaliphilus TaxID=427926 RepID=UPI0022264B83|nr:4Fe-4S binding protein [Dethiobacter alkaliphilus]MCW3490191.1 4Fe-4S binding protein [Dethiobacter alkaliphilus]
MRKTLQSVLQVIFLALFVLLVINGNIQLWMGLFLLGIALSFLLGRVYCGWLCPINTVMKKVTRAKKKLKINNLKTPPFLTNPWVRIAALGLFIAMFVFVMRTGRQLPVLPALFILGVILTLFFSEDLWHRYLCPYGTVMSLPGAKARHTIHINQDNCNNCGACSRVCPAQAVIKDEYHSIVKRDCLICLQCIDTCNQNAISYQ